MNDIFDIIKKLETSPDLTKLRKQYKRKIILTKLNQYDLELAFGLFFFLFIIIVVIL